MHEAGELDFCGFDSIYSADWLGMYTTQGARVHAHTHTHTHSHGTLVSTFAFTLQPPWPQLPDQWEAKD
jgi:hypothetical protein